MAAPLIANPTPPPPASPPPPAYAPVDTRATDFTAPHPHRADLFFPSHWRYVPALSSGAGPFITRLVHDLPSGHRVWWESRKHRKRIVQRVDTPDEAAINTKIASGELTAKQAASLRAVAQAQQRQRMPWYRRLFPFHPTRLSYWTAVLWDIGSVCFVFSSICAFIPSINSSLHLSTEFVGWTAFTGSVGFTVGSIFGVFEVVKAPIVCKIYQMSPTVERNHEASARARTANLTPPPNARSPLVALLLRLDFWVNVIQLIGAVSFNINTFSYSGSFTLTSAQQTGLVFFCDVFASCGFTLSGYLSICEVTHSPLPLTTHPVEDAGKMDMWIAWSNWLGGIGFLTNGVLIIYFPNTAQLQPWYPLLIGSLLFQLGSHLQFLEQADEYSDEDNKGGVSAGGEGGENGVAGQARQEGDGQRENRRVEDGEMAV